MSGRDFTRRRVNPGASWYCVEFRLPPREAPRHIVPGGWVRQDSPMGNPRGMCFSTRAEAQTAATDMAANQGVRTRVRRTTPFCRCYIGDVRVEEIGRYPGGAAEGRTSMGRWRGQR